MSMMTGEPVPVEVASGDEVIGATVNADGTLEVEATRVSDRTAIAQGVRRLTGPGCRASGAAGLPGPLDIREFFPA
ncbi:Copper-exporting P-type ATPase [Geodia barretti]|uniref:Copper-exporting P-type ATPase n=1 Tax=Geodia barretti TaxID=519541 RepID=A0AA35X953_GEOBA|nr:Copper-exporting P-type ATPase [Geodia barretti]